MENSAFAPVKILTDEMPLSLEPQSVSDYSAYQILSLTTLPLTVIDGREAKGLAAESWERSSNGLQYTFKLKTGLRRSNGTRLEGADYVDAIQNLRRDRSKRFARVLADLEGCTDAISASEREICFRLRHPNYFFPELLSLICFSPSNAGAYQIREAHSNLVRLKQNPEFAGCSEKSVSEIEFHKISGGTSSEIDRVLNGSYERSCDTSFPYQRYLELKQTAIRRSRRMAMVLSLGNHCNEIDRDIFDLLFDSIDRETISQNLYSVLSPIHSYLDLFKISHCDQESLEARIPKTPVCLRVAYEDYYPNLEVLALISSQAADLNIEVVPIKEAYGSRAADCHLRLEIRQSPIASPYLFYRSEVSQKAFVERAADQAVRAHRLFSFYQVTGDQQYLLELDSLVRKARVSLPLFEIPGLYLQSQNLSVENDFVPGQIWRFSC